MKTVDVVQGFLGSGKTTLIDALVTEAFPEERILVIQTEWGERELGDYGPRVTVRSWDWEKGFNLVEMRRLLRLPGVNRVIIEVNGMAPVEELLDTLKSMHARGEIALGVRLAVLHGPTWDMMGKPLGDIFNRMAFTSEAFWIRQGNENLIKWLAKIQPGACITSGGHWAEWYQQAVRKNRRTFLRKLTLLAAILAGMYLFFWLILTKI